MMKRQILRSILLAAALAVFTGTGPALAETPWLGGGAATPLREGMIVRGDPGILPWPWYAFPVSFYDDVYVIRRWPRRYRTNIRNGAVHGPQARLNCGQVRTLIRRQGYTAPRAWDCKGRRYVFVAGRGGKLWRITADATNGHIVKVTRLRHR